MSDFGYIRLDAIAPQRLRGENRSPIRMVRYPQLAFGPAPGGKRPLYR